VSENMCTQECLAACRVVLLTYYNLFLKVFGKAQVFALDLLVNYIY
jgi:hypothetical protein